MISKPWTAFAATVVGCVLLAAPAPAAGADPAQTARYVVVLRDGVSPAAEAASHGVSPDLTFTAALDGFAADLTAGQLAGLRSDPAVESVVPDQARRVPPGPRSSADRSNATRQEIPTGVRRIGGLQSPTARIDGKDKRVDADIAVIDSGVDSGHPDLDVVGGFDCTGEGSIDDPIGHGTHVAGTAAALDNRIGVVGVAPGARLWSVRVFDSAGEGSDSTVICAIDWVTAHAATIEVPT